MKNKTLPFFLAFTLFFVIGSKAQTQSTNSLQTIKESISGLEKAVLQKDTSLLQGSIAPNFSVGVATWPASGRLLLTILNRPAAIESIQLVSDKIIDINKQKKKGTVRIIEKGKGPIESDVIFDKNNKILYVDYFDQLYGKFRYEKSVLKAKVPFTFENGIILSVRINNNPKPFRFLFDSGADGAAITKELATTLGLTIDRKQSASVVGGNMNIEVSVDNTFYLDTLALTNQGIAIFEHLKSDVDGIIGLSLAKSFITKVDFDNMEVEFYTFGDYQYEKAGETLPIIVPGGVAQLPASMNIAGKGFINGNFVFDTGANYFLIGFSPFVKKNKLFLESGFEPEGQSSTTSMGVTTPVFSGKCADFRLGENLHLKALPISLQASSSGGWKPDVDGSIGIKLLSRYNFTINLLEKEVHFTPNKMNGTVL